jgi:hypothetical protein
MVDVTVVFRNGDVVNFAAQEFDPDLSGARNIVNKYPYKDARGTDSAIHLRPNEVAGVFVTPGPERREDDSLISVQVPPRT